MLDWLRRNPREEPTLELGAALLPIVIRRTRRARNMTLRLSPDGTEVRVTMPEWGRTAEAVAFARSRGDWLAARLAELPQRQPIMPGGSFAYRGEPVTIDHSPGAPRRPRLIDRKIRLGGPEASIERRLSRWLESEARSLLLADLGHYCERAGRPAPPLALSCARRRWGSCSANGTIRINWRLIMAPDFVRRSVVAHEVAHLDHFNHSSHFHAALAGLFEGDIGAADSWLKREGRSLYRPFG